MRLELFGHGKGQSNVTRLGQIIEEIGAVSSRISICDLDNNSFLQELNFRRLSMYEGSIPLL